MNELIKYISAKQIGFMMLDRNWDISYFHEETASMLRRPSRELIGKNIWGEYPGLEKSELFGACHSVMESKGSRVFQANIAPLAAWVEVVVSWTPEGVAVHIQDITGRVKAEGEALSRLHLLESIIDAMPTWVSVKDKDGRYLIINRKISEDTGLTFEDFKGKHTLELPFGTGNEMAEIHQHDQEVLREGGRQLFRETVFTLADGNTHCIQHHKAPYHDADNQPAGIITVSLDITEQFRARNALEQNKKHLALAQEISETGSWEWCIPANTITWSEEMFRIFDRSPENQGVSPEDYLEPIHPEDKERVFHGIEQALHGKETLDLEHRIILPGNTVRHLHVRGVGYLNENGGPRRMIGIVKDVTTQKRLEMELREYAGRLEESNQELELFASIASHDLQEPLRKISAFGERLATTCGASLDDRGKEYLGRILSSIGRMRKLIDDLLFFSRITSRARPFERVDLKEAARNAWQELEIRVDEIGAQLEVGDLPHVLADPGQMHQLFLNLMSNALKYHRTDVIPTIKIFACAPGQGIPDQNGSFDGSHWFSVEDNGIGFENRYADRIFALFHRLHGRSQYEGTGIGLAVCRKIVERHGGDIAAHGEPGKGSVFTIRLPDNQYLREILINESHNHSDGRRRSG